MGTDMAESGGKEGHSVAVIGIACRFPGDANNAERFWELICNGRCALLSRFPLQTEHDRVNSC